MRILSFILTMVVAVCIFGGCSGQPASPLEPAQSKGARTVSETERHIWGYWDIFIDPDTLTAEISFKRDVSFHLNARKFLEESPCYYCLSIVGVKPSGDGSLLVDIEIKHPFLGLKVYTGFDVRGIAIFPGSHEWPSNGVYTSEGDYGEGEVLNPDGYTRLFNPLEYPPGSGALPIFEYSHGKFAPADPETTLNAYKVFYSNENRRYFATGGTIIVTYDIKKNCRANPFRLCSRRVLEIPRRRTADTCSR